MRLPLHVCLSLEYIPLTFVYLLFQTFIQRKETSSIGQKAAWQIPVGVLFLAEGFTGAVLTSLINVKQQGPEATQTPFSLELASWQHGSLFQVQEVNSRAAAASRSSHRSLGPLLLMNK